MSAQENQDKLFTIVIVVKDDIDGLKTTLTSVLKQTISTFILDILIIDGGKLADIREYVKTCTDKNNERHKAKSIRHICEKDSGIYDAMNKGIKQSLGKWILFLNTGDIFYHENILAELHSSLLHENILDSKKYAYIVGEFCEIWKGHSAHKKIVPISNMPYGMPTSHQAMLIQKEIAQTVLFDTTYKICADAHQFACLIMKGYSVFFYHKILTSVNGEGFSTNNFTQMMKERRRIQKELYPNIRDFLRVSIFIWKEYAKRYIRKLIPKSLQNTLRLIKHKNTKDEKK